MKWKLIHKRLMSIVIAAAIVLTSAFAAPVAVEVQAAEQTQDSTELKPLKLQYLSSASKSTDERTNWERWALPIGNGHMGAMVFGRTETERIQLNEESLWTGGPGGVDDAEGGTYETRDSLSDAYGNIGAYESGAMEALIDDLFEKFYSNATSGTNPAQSGTYKLLPNNRTALGDYQNFAELYMDFNHIEDDTLKYRRELDLRTAVSTVQYDYKDVTYTREMFANYPDNVIVYRITASKENSIDMVIRPEIANLGTTTTKSSGGKSVTKEGTVVADAETGTITMQGTLVNNDMQFAGLFHVETDGTLTANNDDNTKGQFNVEDADSVVIYITLATNYKNNYPDYRQADPDYAIKNATERMEKAIEKKYDTLYANHLADYQELFSRVELDFGGTYDEHLETDKLLSSYNDNFSSGTQNHYLEELYFQYGRYLTIASSREDSLPSNLQGIWNDRVFADWSSDYHTNINLQMNYWPTYSTNLAECGPALLNYVDSLQEPGAITATKYFGTTDGWMTNVAVNIFGHTGNVNNNGVSFSTASAAFLIQNVYDYYQYTQDKKILADQIYPLMTNTCNFYLQTLQSGRTDADSDKLYMVPSYSSEQGIWTVGTYYDQQLIYILFEDTLAAAEELGIENEFTQQLEDTMERLYPIAIGESGQIKEWQQEGKYNRYEFNENKKIGADDHRHNSQLMVLHPGSLITTETPELMQAAKNTLNLRGDGATGWSMGQKFCMWIRLQDGNRAYTSLFKNLMKKGTATNLFDLHPPFQIDGNFGATSGIADMLVQSHAGYVSVLPALPDAMSSGSVRGLVAEGNFVVDIDWEDMEPTYLSIASRSGNELSVKAGVISRVMDVTTGTAVTEFTQNSDGSVSFATEKGHTYQFTMGEEVSLTSVEELITSMEDEGVLSYENTTEAQEEFEEALLACKRMVEQGNYVVSAVDQSVARLTEAYEALTGRSVEEYGAVIALHFLENAESENYTGTDTEDTWRQDIEYDRADLIEALTAGTMETEELIQLADKLVASANSIGQYPEERLDLYDLLKKAKTVEQGERTDEQWTAYFEVIDSYELVFANPSATKEDLEAAYNGLDAFMSMMTTTYHIIASSEGEGSISPDGTVTVLGMTDQKFTMTAEEGNEILDVLVDDMSVGALSEYTIEDVTADGTITAYFRKKQEVKSEAMFLLDTALLRAEDLGEASDYMTGWENVETALAAAQNADRTSDTDMQEKAEALLTAMDQLQKWGDPTRTEAEGATIATEYGDQTLSGNNLLAGYPDGGPVAVNSGLFPDGKWGVQSQGGSETKGYTSAGKQLFCKTAGAWVKFAFEGNRVALVAEEAMKGAQYQIYIDNEFVATINSWTNNAGINNRGATVWDSADYDLELEEKTHELKIVSLLGDQKAQNGATYPQARIDAFDVYSSKGGSDVADAATLAKLIAEVSALTAAQYTEESWNTLQTALTEANEVIADTDKTENEITTAYNALLAAKETLVKVSETITAVTPLITIEVPHAVTKEDLAEVLQNNVVVTAGEKKVRVNIEWNLEGFDGTKAGDTILEGTLTGVEEAGLSNENGMKAKVTVKVAKGSAVITLGNLQQTEGDVTAVTAETEPTGLKVQILYDGLETLPTEPGSHHVTASVIDDNYTGEAEGTLVIAEKQIIAPDNPGTGDSGSEDIGDGGEIEDDEETGNGGGAGDSDGGEAETGGQTSDSGQSGNGSQTGNDGQTANSGQAEDGKQSGNSSEANSFSTTGNSSERKTNSANTGDVSNMMIPFVCMILAMGAIVGSIWYRKCRK